MDDGKFSRAENKQIEGKKNEVMASKEMNFKKSKYTSIQRKLYINININI